MSKNLQFYRAVSVLVGGVVGAGIFGVPLVFARAGWSIALIYLVLLTAVNLLLNLGYGEVILRTGRTHQLIGFAGIYLGGNYKKLTLFTTVLSIYAALLAYIILGGQFLFNITAFQFHWSQPLMSLVFFVVGVWFVWRGLKAISKLDLWMAAFYIAVVAGLVLWVAPQLQISNFVTANLGNWFLPYGVLWFALSGMSSVALQREVLEGQENRLKWAIILGSLVPAVLYLFFSVAVVGISGAGTTSEVFSGLAMVLGQPVLLLGSLFGLLAVFTSFINLGRILMEAFQLDFHVRKANAWALAVLPPFLFFLFGVHDFINVIGFAGAVALGIHAILFVLVYLKVKIAGHRVPEYSLNFPNWLWYGTLIFSLCGVAYELFEKLAAH